MSAGLADQQVQTEDWILFASTVLGSVGMIATSNPMYFYYGLTVGASSKALMSLGPNLESWEDWMLFAGAFLGSLGSALSGDTTYMLYGLVLGAIGKAIPSLVQNPRSLEDWLLLVLPVATGIGAAISSHLNLSMVGLFFGMVAKSLAGVAPPAAAQSGLAGNRNYILWDGCKPEGLVNPSVAFTAGTDMQANANWDLQVNAYAPSGTNAYMQFVIAVTTTGQVQWSIEEWPPVSGGNNLFNTGDQLLCQLPSAFLPKGYSIAVKMSTDPGTNNVTSVQFSVTDPAGAQVAQQNVPLNATLPVTPPNGNGAWNNAYLSKVIGFEPNIVGYNNGQPVTFSPGCAGSLACTANSISASSSIPACAETKAGTVENSNLQYSTAAQVSGSLVTIGASAP